MSSRRFTRREVLGFVPVGLGGCAGSVLAGGRRLPDASEATYDLTVAHDVDAWAGLDPDWTASAESPEVGVRAEAVIARLEVPWDLEFAPNGDLFLTERTGRISHYRDGEEMGRWRPRDAIEAGSKPAGNRDRSWWVPGGEGGTMGIAIHPRYPAVPLVYVYYTAGGGDGSVNRIVAFDASADEPARRAWVVVDDIPAGTYHDGGRIAFGPANALWATTGDAGNERDAQDPSSLAGKVLRMTPEGEPMPGNHDFGPGSDPRVYTLGHRNPQGIAWLPDGTPVITEHGPGPDEVSLLSPGENYGWPDVRSPRAYVDAAAGAADREEAAGVHPPVASSAGGDTWAPSGCLFYTGDGVPAWRNRLLVGCLVSQRLKVFTLTPPGEPSPPLGETGVRYDADWLDGGFTATAHDALVDGLGRIRHVAQGLDGGLYAITSNRDGRAHGRFPTERDDVLVRLRPVRA